MDATEMISVIEFCRYNDIEVSFIEQLSEHGIITLILVDETPFLALDQLRELETFITFHYEMDINIAGIDTIVHLLRRTEDLHLQIKELNDRLAGHSRQANPDFDINAVP